MTAAAVGSAVTSYKGVRVDGIFADGKLLIVNELRVDGEAQLFLSSTYEVDDDGDGL